jgi:hypothetical protein
MVKKTTTTNTHKYLINLIKQLSEDGVETIWLVIIVSVDRSSIKTHDVWALWRTSLGLNIYVG